MTNFARGDSDNVLHPSCRWATGVDSRALSRHRAVRTFRAQHLACWLSRAVALSTPPQFALHGSFCLLQAVHGLPCDVPNPFASSGKRSVVNMSMSTGIRPQDADPTGCKCRCVPAPRCFARRSIARRRFAFVFLSAVTAAGIC